MNEAIPKPDMIPAVISHTTKIMPSCPNACEDGFYLITDPCGCQCPRCVPYSKCTKCINRRFCPGRTYLGVMRPSCGSCACPCDHYPACFM